MGLLEKCCQDIHAGEIDGMLNDDVVAWGLARREMKWKDYGSAKPTCRNDEIAGYKWM